MNLYVQYGCGLSAPEGWVNFDSSPTLRLQKFPLIGEIAKKKVHFPDNVKYGDIIKGLPDIKRNSCDGIYCSHVLEHLCLNDFKKALDNTYILLNNSGIFRCVLPDLQFSINEYLIQKQNKDTNASINFLKSTMLGVVERPASLKEKVFNMFGNSKHLWMWDAESMKEYLLQAGFSSVRLCSFNDSKDPMFKLVEEESRFYAAIAFECYK